MMAHEVERPEKVDPEVVEKAQRRRFSASYKQKTLDEIAQCSNGTERGRSRPPKGALNRKRPTGTKSLPAQEPAGRQ